MNTVKIIFKTMFEHCDAVGMISLLLDQLLR